MTVGSGTVAAQLVPLAITPWLTRLYGPASFGAFAVFLSVVMTISLLASGRYEMGVPVVDDDDEAARLLVGSLVVLLGFAVFSALVVGAFWMLLGVSYPMWPLWDGLAFVVFAGVLQSCSCWFARKERYRSLSVARFTVAVMASGASVALGWFTAEPWGLATGAVAGQAVGAATALVLAWASLAAAWKDRSVLAVRRALREHVEFPRVNAPHVLVDGLREAGFYAVFAGAFGAAANGAYGLGVRLLRVPAALVGGAISQVLFGRFSRDRREGRATRGLLLRMVGLLAAVSLPVFGLIVLMGPSLFAFVFGSEWREAGRYARIMAPALWVSFAISPAVTLPVVAGRMRGALGFALGDLTLRAVSLAVGYSMSSASVALVCMSIGGVAMLLGLGAWYVKIAASQDTTLVVFLGQSRWCRLLAQEMNRHAAADTATVFAAVPLERPGSALRWSSVKALLNADVLVRVGFRPAGQTPRGRLFELAWAALRKVNPSADAVMYWVGTDVLRTLEMLGGGLNEIRFRRVAASMSHLAGSENLREELASIGIESRVAWFPGLTLQAPGTVPPLPGEFAVLSYVPDSRPDFYGGPVLIELARALPSIKVRIVGGSGSWAPDAPRNVEFVGWVDDMASEYRRSTVVVRLVDHDAIGATAIEGLMFGRQVVYSGDLLHCTRVEKGDPAQLIATIASILSRWQRGEISLGAAAAHWAADQFSQTERIAALRDELEKCHVRKGKVRLSR
jgi:O-antigen/teichoic acid export membrane protein